MEFKPKAALTEWANDQTGRKTQQFWKSGQTAVVSGARPELPLTSSYEASDSSAARR